MVATVPFGLVWGRVGNDLIKIHTTTRGIAIEDGGYHWRGELRLWDNEILMGWYAANDGSVRSKGTMYFVLHPHGLHIEGRRVGLTYDGSILTDWGGIGRTEEDARATIAKLRASTTTATTNADFHTTYSTLGLPRMAWWLTALVGLWPGDCFRSRTLPTIAGRG